MEQCRATASFATVSASALQISFCSCSYARMLRIGTPERRESSSWVRFISWRILDSGVLFPMRSRMMSLALVSFASCRGWNIRSRTSSGVASRIALKEYPLYHWV